MLINKFHRGIFFFLLLMSVGNAITAQRIDSLVSILDKKYPQEKIHLHLDKEFYSAGETIWFKAYLVADNRAAAISKSMYAELIDEKGNLLQRKIAPVTGSDTAYYFELPHTIHFSQRYQGIYSPDVGFRFFFIVYKGHTTATRQCHSSAISYGSGLQPAVLP